MSPEQQKEADDLFERLEMAAAALGEHYDSVVLIATKQYGESDEYVRFKAGSGNYYAQIGSAREWVLAQDEKVAITERKKAE